MDMVVSACARGHGHCVWEFHCAGLGLGLGWFVWLRVPCWAACDTGPPSGAPSQCPATVSLTPSAGFHGIGNRQ